VFVNDTGNPVLATAGTGDVLTGVIASLMAQGMPAYEAAALGVHLHGSAADEWARRRGRAGLLARELADELPEALETYRVTTEPHPGSRNQPA
ncbi:MAG: ADP-dependent NAD(P)H-hydrate dehydratase, partial [Phycisphaeraceae bacterium]